MHKCFSKKRVRSHSVCNLPFTCSKVTIETQEQRMKYVES